MAPSGARYGVFTRKSGAGLPIRPLAAAAESGRSPRRTQAANAGRRQERVWRAKSNRDGMDGSSDWSVHRGPAFAQNIFVQVWVASWQTDSNPQSGLVRHCTHRLVVCVAVRERAAGRAAGVRRALDAGAGRDVADRRAPRHRSSRHRPRSGCRRPEGLQSGALEGQALVRRAAAARPRRRDLIRERDRPRATAIAIEGCVSRRRRQGVCVVDLGVERRAVGVTGAGVMIERPALGAAGAGHPDQQDEPACPSSRSLRNDCLRLGVREAVRIAREILLRGDPRSIVATAVCKMRIRSTRALSTSGLAGYVARRRFERGQSASRIAVTLGGGRRGEEVILVGERRPGGRRDPHRRATGGLGPAVAETAGARRQPAGHSSPTATRSSCPAWRTTTSPSVTATRVRTAAPHPGLGATIETENRVPRTSTSLSGVSTMNR